MALGRLDPATSRDAIVAAADEILAGRSRDQFVVDVYQAGAGTSHNMNANEVLANRAAEILGEPRGAYTRVHPNDHVNMGQSTNDVFPTATRLALLLDAPDRSSQARARLAGGLDDKATSSRDVLKTGRTHLQDAVPITLGQEFGGFAACIERGADDVERACGAAARAESRRHGRRHRTECRRRLHRRAVDSIWRATRVCRCGRRRTSSASRRAWEMCSRIPARCGGWRSRSARSRATCGCSAWGRAPASRRSSCPPCSRARRSCPAR